MDNTGYIALSRQTTLWRRMDMVANNLANMNTAGYRGQDALFVDYLARTPNTDSAFRERVSFTQDLGSVYDLSAGHMRPTSAPMDLALDDQQQFFAVETPGGIRYSRGGHFMLNQDGMLTSGEGYAILGDNDEPLFIAPNESHVEILENGTVQTENGPIGTLKVVTFDAPRALKRTGDVLWEPREDQQPTVAETPRVKQGMLEGSNVNGVVEMTRMIAVQRAYEAVGKLVAAENDRVLRAVKTWGRVT